ncbi:hypothetical protein EVAR_99900_1 [Eumeta japonica]|uniref:Uncharacterized protein n=1 Tax=Eumeta variegata TaxID=151549 RepID=A0A4C1ZRQ4_EUMVA|nr:hypothetical protein EVAR_99900_1 [Eumeta japonica]
MFYVPQRINRQINIPYSGDSAAESQNEEECIELYNPESLVVHPNDDNKIVCRVEKPKINSTLFMEYEGKFMELKYKTLIQSRLSISV